eukprot:TRINITY_DN707_c2_g1_i2.p1 TRINITY_DN707_c2_g1~~TRINITY_DN707_c2_g1_i2.p1  ORF type:complete len:338 (+),score=54.91 TRINITY_DN707_c2_g1_i2:204-1217(+)
MRGASSRESAGSLLRSSEDELACLQSQLELLAGVIQANNATAQRAKRERRLPCCSDGSQQQRKRTHNTAVNPVADNKEPLELEEDIFMRHQVAETTRTAQGLGHVLATLDLVMQPKCLPKVKKSKAATAQVFGPRLLLTDVEAVKPGEHACCCHNSRERLVSVSARFWTRAIHSAKVALLVTQSSSIVEQVLQQLSRAGVDTKTLLQSDKIQFLAGGYLTNREEFTGSLQELKNQLSFQRAKGYSEVHIIGQPNVPEAHLRALLRAERQNNGARSSASGGRLAAALQWVRAFLRFESDSTAVLRQQCGTGLCVYDASTLPSTFVSQGEATHPCLIVS